ncbi:MAG: molybdopterin molybdotransferase MoeA [Hyphomicrobiales bacterium]|nr:molybdopterin molybdotransferase MoeA [Hyphomicrobiales bacterium]
MSLLSVKDAKARILKGVKPLSGELVDLSQAPGRVLSKPVTAKRDQPAFACSAMDGYAVRAADVTSVPIDLEVIGESKAGGAFTGKVGTGQAVNIYTGAPVPRGADAIVIQEDTRLDAGTVTVLEAARPGKFVRPQAFDFRRGQTLIEPPRLLTPRDIGVAASANCARIPVRKRPVIALIGTGDELVLPGDRPRSDQIVSSNNASLASFIRHFGGEPMDLGIVPDRLGAIKRAIGKARDADIMVTIGGASVGKHDLVQQALTESGIKMNFWRIAMRPGKPLMFARRARQRIIGLPGNPVSALVCARIFLKPLIDALLGLAPEEPIIKARLGAPLAANDQRQDYLRARLARDANGHLTVTSFAHQDSSMQAIMANADALIIRPPFARAARKGAAVDVLPIDF